MASRPSEPGEERLPVIDSAAVSEILQLALKLQTHGQELVSEAQVI